MLSIIGDALLIAAGRRPNPPAPRSRTADIDWDDRFLSPAERDARASRPFVLTRPGQLW